MSAAVADIWQGVILRKNRHSGAIATTTGQSGSKGSLNAANATFYLESMLLQGTRKQLSRMFFFIVQFRVGVDVQ
jgi:hypothetical protein